MPIYDLLIKGGHVIDPANNVDTLADVGVAGRVVAAVKPGIDKSEGRRVVDAAGMYVTPGLIDMHAHHHRDHEGVLPKKNWESAVYLAYGVTTTLDNSQWSSNVFPAAELVESGAVIGPRMYSTGDPIYSGDGSRQNEISIY